MKNIVYKDNQIIITPSYLKKEILEDCKLKYNIKVISIEELKEKYLFKYKDDTLVYIDKKYNLIPEIGKIILNNLYEIDVDKEYNDEKLDNLKDIKNDLIENGYIIYDNYFKTYLSNKDIAIIDDVYDSKTSFIINSIDKSNNVTHINIYDNHKDRIEINEFNTLEEEVIFVATKITSLINSGISINKIKINKLDSVYKAQVNKIFDFYNIPFIINDNKLFFINDIKKFLSKLDGKMTLIELNDIIEDIIKDEKIKNKLVNIINKYTSYDYVKDIKKELIYDIKNSNISLDKYDNLLEEIDYKKYYPKDDEYIFILGLNQDCIPKIYKDDSYLSDKQLSFIGSDTSIQRNSKEVEKLNIFINNTKNIILSYKLSSNFQKFYIANYIKDLSSVTTVDILKKDYDYSNEKVNKLLLASRLDNYIKYSILSDDLNNLYSTYPNIDYLNYSNKYTKIDNSIIRKQLDNKINLSFSNTNTFFRCKFRFLLDNIYKLAPFEETISQKIGTLFHNVLCNIYKDNRSDYDEVIKEEIDKLYINPTSKEKFYIKKYTSAIKSLINLLNDELKRTSYENTYFEEWFSVETNNDLKINIVGKIDKILTLKDGISTYVIVIDYKTGSLHNDFNKVIYGLDMQLLYYLYLIKNTTKIKNPVFTGMYLQSIMTEVLASVKNKKYIDLVLDNMKLNGYTTDDVSRLAKIDNNYEDGSFIRGIRVKNDGTFYSTSKVLSDDTMNKLIDIVSENIQSVIDSINESDFQINPIKIDNDNYGCEYCPFGDICYKTSNDVKEVKGYDNLDFLGGEENDSN